MTPLISISPIRVRTLAPFCIRVRTHALPHTRAAQVVKEIPVEVVREIEVLKEVEVCVCEGESVCV